MICENSLYTVHMTCLPASQDSSQHIKCWKPSAVIYGLALLKMGIIVPETCWANGLLINHNRCTKSFQVASLEVPMAVWFRAPFFCKMTLHHLVMGPWHFKDTLFLQKTTNLLPCGIIFPQKQSPQTARKLC